MDADPSAQTEWSNKTSIPPGLQYDSHWLSSTVAEAESDEQAPSIL
jgi:hypothetical protein